MTDTIFRQYYGENNDKAMRLAKDERDEMRRDFLKKFPDADIDKFRFEVSVDQDLNVKKNIYYKIDDTDDTTSYDITSDTFLNNKEWTKYLTINKKVGFGIWSPKEEIPKFQNLRYPNDPTRQGWGNHPIIDSSFQTPVNLGSVLNKFRIHLSVTEYFFSNFPPISEDWKKGKTLNENVGLDIRDFPHDYEKEPYFAMICATYVASFLCGISLKHLSEHKNTPKIITSLARYHLYYQIRKFMKKTSLLNKYKSYFQNPIRKYHPIRHISTPSVGRDRDGNYFISKGTVNYSTTDYKSYIAYDSHGLTKIGQKLFQQSVESYVYTVLGAQAKTRWSIVNSGAKSSQTQDVFHKLVEDTIAQSDTTVTTSNMRRAIKDTHVVLNLAISPGVILTPSRMIILENPIEGFNNMLTIATNDMNFGYNTNVNDVVRKIIEKPKKQLQTEIPTEHLESFDTNEITNNIPKNTSDPLESQESRRELPFEKV